MGHYDECREGYCSSCGQTIGNCSHTSNKKEQNNIKYDINLYKELLKQREELDRKLNKFDFTNAKLFHIDSYLLIHNDEFDSVDEIVSYIDSRTNINLIIANQESCNILWYDDIDINKRDCPIEKFKKYFEKR